MKRNAIVVALSLLTVVAAGCYSHRYEPEPVGTTAPKAGEAPAADVAGAAVSGTLLEFGKRWYGASAEKGEGILSVTGDQIAWKNYKDAERSFSVRSSVVKDVWLVCARKPAQNICLELGFRTVTDLEFRFRDQNWAGGENREIQKIYTYLQANFREIHFEEKVVDTID